MALNFGEYFSTEQGGYELLYQNMKSGLNAGRELADFLRERSSIEETNSKLLAKVAKQAGGASGQGTFAPVWAALRASAERLSALHLHMFHKVGELVKDVSKYADDLHKKHKAVKDSEAGTLEAALATQAARQALHKAEDACHAKAVELDKLKEAGSGKDLEKIEAKLKKLRDDRAALAEKHAAARRDFEKKMSLTCKHFQDVEETHLKQMKQFVGAYVELTQANHGLVGQVHVDLKHRCLEMTVENLLERFVLEKYGAGDRPSPGDGDSKTSRPASLDGENDRAGGQESSGPMSAIARLANRKEPSFAAKTSRRTTSLLNLFTPNFQSKDESAGTQDGATPCSAPSSPSGAQADAAARAADKTDDQNSGGRNPLRESKWFLRSRRTRAKQKKSKKKNDATEERSDPDEREEEVVKEAETEAEAEQAGSPEVDEDGYRVRPKDDKPGAYSTSDSDSDEEPERKIRVEIKPLSNGAGPMSASVDELLATVENLSLFPGGRRTSTARSGGDLLGLDFFRSPSGGDPSSPPMNWSSPPRRAGTLDSPAPDGDVLSEVGDLSHSSDRRSTATPSVSSIAIPRPPSRRSEAGDFRAGVGNAGSSRGPSPLTIGMADTIPLAVAFHEIVHTYFRGGDETKCQVKMSGDMMLSFPTGIVGVLTNNPNPAKLSFRLKNALRLEDVSPNRQLITTEPGRSLRDGAALEFNMNALTSLLKKQSEKNPTASYFNVDILKYRVRPGPGASSCPFQLVAYWKCDRAHTDLKIDYKYNMHAMSSPSPLLNLSVAVPLTGGVRKVNSKPPCHSETGEQGSMIWKFTELSQHSDDGGIGSLKARVELSEGPSSKGTISSQFNCEGATLSGVEFELVGSGYRISLVKRRFVSGKYICDGD